MTAANIYGLDGEWVTSRAVAEKFPKDTWAERALLNFAKREPGLVAAGESYIVTPDQNQHDLARVVKLTRDTPEPPPLRAEVVEAI